MAYVNVAEWSPEHVADWLKGLDDEIQPYTQFFVNNSINGCHLLTLCRDDLSNLNISKVGHQELVLEAVDLLKQLHYNLTSETLQSLALKLGCKAQSLFNHLKHVCKNHEAGQKERVSTETLSAVSDIIDLVKSLISWLDRYPFFGQEKYVHVRKAVLKLSVELTSTAQRDQFAEMPHKIIKDICASLSTQSDKIVQEFNDSLIIQPAVLEVAKIKRKVDDDVGIHINSSCSGIHVIESIKFQSPAYRCGKVEDGDEIVQVNYQTVVGWQVRNIICAMKEHPSEVHLTLKKRPRHPNVLGQVITLWPYRIPSKKTALRKLYKWNKGKATGDINDICPKSPEIRCDMNSVPENYSIPINDKERQLFFGRSRSRIRRRATITGISPTALQPLLSLDDLIGSNSKKKQSVGRAVSYDPGKVGNVDDSVFNDVQDADLVSKGSSSETAKHESGVSKCEKEPPAPKSQFLKPPTEKYLGSCLRRQQPVTEILPPNEVNDIKLMVDFVKPDSDSRRQSSSSMPNDLLVKTPPVVPSKKESPSLSESSRPKLDWLGKQKAKLEGMGNGNSAYSGVNQKPRTGSTASCINIETTPPNPRVNGNGAFPTREGRPSLSEIRALKRAADAKSSSDKVESHPRKNVPSLPRQNVMHQRNMQGPQNKLGGCGIKYGNTKENELNQRLNGVTMIRGKKPTVHFSRNPESLKYSVIPQYPFEMHESKIVSLKHKQMSNHPRNKISYVSEPMQNGAINGVNKTNFLSKNLSLSHKPTHARTGLKNAHNGKSNSFNPLFGRSRSYNDIAFSSDSSSSYEDEEEEEDDVYEEINDRRRRFLGKQFRPPNGQSMNQSAMNSNFAAKVAEVYYMLNQGHCFPAPSNGRNTGRLDPASTAFIDELAKSMYQALQQDHMKEQGYIPSRFVPAQKNERSKSLSRDPVQLNSYNKRRQEENLYGHLASCGRSVYNQGYNNYSKNQMNFNGHAVQEKPVDLSPPTYASNKHSVPAFKSATSQEILSLYTSQVSNKSPNNSISHCGYEKLDHSGSFEHSENVPIYESMSLYKTNQPPFIRYPPGDGSVRIGHGNQSIMFCPAERESESIQCNDKIISSPSDGWKYFDKGMFQPIREETSIDEIDADEHVVPSADRLPATSEKNRTYSQSSNEVGMYFCQNAVPESSCKIAPKKDYVTSPNKPHHRNVPPSLSSLVNSVPKPPEEDFCLIPWKCSDAQTETDNTSGTEFPESFLKDDSNGSMLQLGNDDSFCTVNSDADNPNFTRSGSLSSNGSSSTISSTNSSYYYVDSPNHSRPLIKLSSVSSENDSETGADSHRSPPLPTMGVSMLGKKRPSHSGGSDSGCNSEPHQHSNEDITMTSVIDSGDEFPSPSIITDNIQFSVWKC